MRVKVQSHIKSFIVISYCSRFV